CQQDGPNLLVWHKNGLLNNQPNFLFGRALEQNSNRRSELLTNRTCQWFKMEITKGYLAYLLFVPVALVKQTVNHWR
ncbi:hypothetical protein, partial [uncultured Metabacillus sp.]|uniref:hypothetical protein n=1 Tax=uncultured Metabacillus sp. TaxID=2860135 RepID=UPI00261B2C64